MKKIAKLFLVFLLVIGLTGCVKYNVNMEVKDDKSVTLEVIYGMEISDDLLDSEYEEDSWSDDEDDEWLNEEDSDTVTTDDYEYLEELGYKVEEFEEEKDGSIVSGVKITKTFDNIDDITSSEKVVVDFNALFSSENKEDIKNAKFFYKDGNSYKANFVFDFLEGADEDTRKESESYDAMITDLSYQIKLPVKAKENNATKVSEGGKTLTWNLAYSKLNEVNFEFSLKNSILPIIIAVIGGIAIIAIVVICLVKKKKNSNVSNEGQTIPNVQQGVTSQSFVNGQATTPNNISNNNI